MGEEGTAEERRVDGLLAQLDVPEHRYKADMMLQEQSSKLSTELLRLALAGIAVVGFLLAPPNGLLPLPKSNPAEVLLIAISVVAFAVSVGCALLHRFYASGGSFHHLQVIKLVLLKDSGLDVRIGNEMKIRTKKFQLCHRFLQGAGASLTVAACSLGVAFILVLVSPPH